MDITIDQEWKILSSLLPNGQFWRNKNNIDSRLGILLRTFAFILNKFRIYNEDINQELIATKINRFVDLWEKFLGIPDVNFPNISIDLNERIKIILIKLFGLQAVTKSEIINLIKYLYPQVTNIRIQSGRQRGSFPLQFPIYFFANASHATRYIFVNLTIDETINSEQHFPLPFPIQFYSSVRSNIKLLLEALMPFSMKIIMIT
jgi:hypothetical protein